MPNVEEDSQLGAKPIRPNQIGANNAILTKVDGKVEFRVVQTRADRFMMQTNMESLKVLEQLDFGGKAESTVEQKYLAPLLELLGYEKHKDYEVIRHGDEGSSFKLKYPPVEKGAVRVKHYNPDYVPTIRKKAFWVIEAKSPKDVSYPFEAKFLVQGLQYCIHPEIQAKYLVVSNGEYTAVYDVHGSVFLGKDMYEPIFTFRPKELSAKWQEIYELLSAEKLRNKIETDLKAMYDKLALSSLDSSYPGELLKKIGTSQREHSLTIEKHVNHLRVEMMDAERGELRRTLENLDAAAVYQLMDQPLLPGTCQGQYFVAKCLSEGEDARRIITKLIVDFRAQCIFRKEQTFAALCSLYQQTGDETVKAEIQTFLDQHKESELPLLNQAECAALRVTRKVAIVSLYPALRASIAKQLQSVPELVRYVQAPSALSMSYPIEIENHWRLFQELKRLPEPQLRMLCDVLLKFEADIQEEFNRARAKLTDSERQIGGFEYYGVEGRHYAFKNIMENFKIE